MDLIERLLEERNTKLHGGIYDITQKRFAYHSNKIEGSSLTENQVSFIYDTKIIANIVGNMETTPVERVEEEMRALLIGYNLNNAKELEYLTTFHANFEKIHPFADGNGRVGRLLLYKECLKEGIIPFIVDDSNKSHYYSALEELQLRDNKEPLLTYFQGEQKNYINYLKNKNFDGYIN